MNNDTERLASQVAKAVKNAPNGMFTLKVIAAADHILSTTTPPTMADVEWDDDKHCLREAEHPEYGKVIMLSHINYCNQIAVLWSGSRKFIDLCVVPEDLTPTGRRYTLTEVQE